MDDELNPTQDSALADIAAHLKSIRSMLTFFTVLTVIGLVLGVFNFILSF